MVFGLTFGDRAFFKNVGIGPGRRTDNTKGQAKRVRGTHPPLWLPAGMCFWARLCSAVLGVTDEAHHQ